MIEFIYSLCGRYVLLFVLLASISLSFYYNMKHSIENSIRMREVSDALSRENMALRSGDRLLSSPNWMYISDKYERKSN